MKGLFLKPIKKGDYLIMEKEQEEQLHMYRHSMAHVLAKALTQLWPDVKLTIGPAIDNGFYYDIDLEHSITPDDFKAISDKMDAIIKNNEDFVRREVSKAEALEMFKDNKYKTELINEMPEDEVITVYYTGDDFVDLCRGPHVENTKYLRGFAYKIAKVNGAYWRGNEKNKMLQRVYVYGFLNKEDLKQYVNMMEEALKRDHRKLGKELQLYFISDYAKGMPTYMPKGLILKNTLIDFWREIHRKAGYIEIETPMAMNRQLWEVSGHWDHYKSNMYTFTVEDETFAIKPMNCPGGMLYYQQNIHSYKEFPLRVGELGKVHRHEASGTLNGLLRVRCFTQDDAHIFMLPSQIEDEIKNVMKLVDQVYTTFGLKYTVELSTMPESHIGEVSEWEMAETALSNALKHMGLDFKINPGDGAFYGPKIDIHVTDCIGREWQCGTIQLDMQLPKRFNLTYVDSDGSLKEPIMIHRVIYGSMERMIAVLIENFAGAFPTWLAPVQVKILNIADSHLEYANKIKELLDDNNIRVELDDRNEKIGKKIREAQLEKVPYMLVIGDKEVEEGKVSVRHRKEGDKGSMTIDEFLNMIKAEIKSKEIK
ncbi:MAG TPA: threonine--tRNA ligase [Clostridiales bacterium]|nr:threonine--tRNA ligase [Clostridiales bacterium]